MYQSIDQKTFSDRIYLKHADLVLRTAAKGDAGQLAVWWNDGAVMAHAGFPKGLGITKEEVLDSLNPGLLVMEKSGVLIGESNFNVLQDRAAEIGIKICDAAYQNRGIGKIVLSMLIRHLFACGFDKILLDTNLENKRAQHVYESLGFKKLRVNIDAWEDQLGRMQSSVDYELTRDCFVDYTNKA